MFNIYLSLTTLPIRLSSDHFKKVYNSLLNQSIPFTKLIINLSIKEFTYDIPKYLYDNENVILHETNICGPCTKLIGSIDIIPDDSIVIILDDDIVMRNNFIKSLYDSYLINPSKVTSHFTSVRNNYNEVAGFGGYIFNINNLRNIKQFYTTMPECCIKIDDNWISWCIHKLGIDVINTVEKDPWNTVLDIPSTETHPEWYELCKNTNRDKLIAEMEKILK
uniref:Glycosyltransferase 2-like domain-containing protein n=1 Tax=viral metagenome TaxID=1070528 RepID=A0A6C0EPV1_9ZZZZ